MPITPDNNGAGIGPQGPQGIQGPPGADGADGAPGADGADGAPGPGFSNYTDDFTNETTLVVPAGTHARTGTLKVEVRRTDGVNLIAPFIIGSPVQDVTVYFAQATSGTIIITGDAP